MGDERVRGEPKQLRLEELDDGVPVRKFVYGGIGVDEDDDDGAVCKKGRNISQTIPNTY